jgi:hypothetical protein
METLHWHNSPLIMSQCGSKGSPINIAQVGQAVSRGTRAPELSSVWYRNLKGWQVGVMPTQWPHACVWAVRVLSMQCGY